MTRNNAGFSLLEMTMVVALIIIATSMAVIHLMPSLNADSGVQQLMTQLRQTRLSSIDQRRDFTVTFQGTNELVIVRQNLPSGTTTISDTVLPTGTTYMVFAGLPDTPDGFGNTNALNFGCPGNTVPCSILFQSDGTVLANGSMINGTVFLGMTGNSASARAVTVMGSTGRIRSYHWTGNSWS